MSRGKLRALLIVNSLHLCLSLLSVSFVSQNLRPSTFTVAPRTALRPRQRCKRRHRILRPVRDLLTLPPRASHDHVWTLDLGRLTSIVMSRFMLRLQAASKKSTGMLSSVGSQVDSVVFQRVIGSLGASVEPGDYVARERPEERSVYVEWMKDRPEHKARCRREGEAVLGQVSSTEIARGSSEPMVYDGADSV